jgi:acetyltransferase-like isoleucine patch superfamily enzyme
MPWSNVHETAKIYETAKIAERTTLNLKPECVIGDFVLVAVTTLMMDTGAQVNAGAKLVGKCNVLMGKGAVVGYNAVLLTSTDRPTGLMYDAAPGDKRDVLHGDIYLLEDSFVGSGAIIFPGVAIGEGAVVGAGAVVKEDVGPWTIVKPDYRSLLKEPRRLKK